MKHSKFVLYELCKLMRLTFLVLLTAVTILTISTSYSLADDPVKKNASDETPADPWFEPSTMVQVYTGQGETGWQIIPYASVPWEIEYLFEERFYHIDAEGWVRVNRRVIANTASLAEADRPYEPDNWRWPEQKDLVRFVDEDNHHLSHDLAKNVQQGDRFWFQGILYEGITDPVDASFLIMTPAGYVLNEHRQIVQEEVLPASYGSRSNDISASQANLPTETGMQNMFFSAGSDSSPTDFNFTGKRLEQFGLLDYEARYYNPILGRFISPDTIVPNFANPQLLNRYSYVNNNPLRYTDPTGHQCVPACPPMPVPYSDLIKGGAALMVAAPETAPIIGTTAVGGLILYGTMETIVPWAMQDMGPDYPLPGYYDPNSVQPTYPFPGSNTIGIEFEPMYMASGAITSMADHLGFFFGYGEAGLNGFPDPFDRHNQNNQNSEKVNAQHIRNSLRGIERNLGRNQTLRDYLQKNLGTEQYNSLTNALDDFTNLIRNDQYGEYYRDIIGRELADEILDILIRTGY